MQIKFQYNKTSQQQLEKQLMRIRPSHYKIRKQPSYGSKKSQERNRRADIELEKRSIIQQDGKFMDNLILI